LRPVVEEEAVVPLLAQTDPVAPRGAVEAEPADDVAERADQRWHIAVVRGPRDEGQKFVGTLVHHA
jgi:hypothetical protein